MLNATIKYNSGKAFINYGLATAYRCLKNYEESLTCGFTAQKVWGKMGHSLGDAMCSSSIGDTYLFMEDYHSALTHIEQALNMFKDMNFEQSEHYFFALRRLLVIKQRMEPEKSFPNLVAELVNLSEQLGLKERKLDEEEAERFQWLMSLKKEMALLD